VIPAEETAKLISEAVEKSPIFAQKLAYWVHRRKGTPSERWMVANLIAALGYKRVAMVIGEHTIMAAKPAPLRFVHKLGKKTRELFKIGKK